MALIEGLHEDLKVSTDGWGFCEVLTNSDETIIQRWTSLYNRNYIYIAYITNANTDNPTIAWKTLSLT